MKYACAVTVWEGHGLHPRQPLPPTPSRASSPPVVGRETGSTGSSADPHFTCQGAERIPPCAPREQPHADTPCCSAYQAGGSRVCLNILRSIYNSRNKSKPRCLCAYHVQCPLHFFPCVAPIRPLKSPSGRVDIWGYFPTSSRGGKFQVN